MMKKYLSTVITIIVLFSCACDKNPLSFIRKAIFKFPTEAGPIAIDLDEGHGIIYVASYYPGRNRYNRKIQAFYMNGTFLRTVVDFTNEQNGLYSHYYPIDLTIDDEHNLYVLVRPYCVLKFNSNGKFQKEYNFDQPEEWSFFSACAFYRGFIYVTDGRVIKIINSKTEQIYDFPLPEDEIDDPKFPEIHTTDMAIDSKGNIWLAGQVSYGNDSLGCHITKLDPLCKQSRTFYSRKNTSRYGADGNHAGIALGMFDNIYLATSYCRTVEIFDMKGHCLRQIEILDGDGNYPNPIDIAVGNGKIYVLDSGWDVIRVYQVGLSY